MITLLQELEYNRWANRRVMVAVARLDAEQFTRRLGGSFASVRDTLVHMLWAEWLWLERWQGHSPKSLLNAADYPTPGSVVSRWEEIQEQQRRFLEALEAEGAERRVRYTNFEGVEWEYTVAQMVRHIMNHSAYHRGQIATLLRQIGLVPPHTDYLVHIDELAGARACRMPGAVARQGQQTHDNI